MSFRIPKEQMPALMQVLGMTAEQQSALQEAVESAPLEFGMGGLEDRISGVEGLERNEAGEIAALFVSMLLASIDRGGTAEQRNAVEFAEEVCATLAGVAEEEIEPGRLENLRNLLAAVLDSNSLCVASKAMFVQVGHQRVFSSSRIFTDIRPVFSAEESPVPIASVAIHSLCIRLRESSRMQEFYVALDNHDLESLRREIDRALAKEKSMRAIMTGTAAEVLDV